MTEATVLIDLNNLGMMAQMGTKTKLSAGSIDTTAIYGTMRMLQQLRRSMHGQFILLHDGRSWRHSVYDGYKAGREANADLVTMRDAWKAAKPAVCKMAHTLGIHQVRADNLEADDLAAILRRSLNAQGKEVILISSDHDWLQLINDQTSLYDPKKDRWVNSENFTSKIDLPTPYSLAEFKALTGDVSDSIPGVGGIGEKTAKNILNTWHSVGGFLNVMLTDANEYAAADRRARTLVDDEERQRKFQDNMKLVYLDSSAIPQPINLRYVRGTLDRTAFEDMCGEYAFISMLKDMDKIITLFGVQENNE